MDVHVFEELERQGVTTAADTTRVKTHEQGHNISVHWDLRTLLYFGVLLVTGGLGILLYKNIDTIGHAVIVGLTGMFCAVCLFYCFRKAAPFSRGITEPPNLWFDYILLLGCLLMLTFIGYLQYQYHVFGIKWGMATFIPMLFLFFFAYRFDHKGVLTLAITNLGAWMGIALEPMKFIRGNQFSDDDIIVNGVILGALMHLFWALTENRAFKAHFGIVYKNFAVHVLLFALLAAMAHFDNYYLLWFLPLIGMAAWHMRRAIAERSFYFLVVSVLYGYAGASYVIVRFIDKVFNNHGDDTGFYLICLYFIGSGIGLVVLLTRYNKQLKQ